MIELCIDEENIAQSGAKLKVIGIGGAGGNAVNSMTTDQNNPSVEFIIANTDAQALQLSPVLCKIQLGSKVTKGLGAGSNPDIGRRAAEETLETVVQNIAQSDILFLTAGLGGGTGTGALPVIANAAKELGILTVAVVTKPFLFEGKRRMKYAEEAVKQLKEAVDTLIVVPNQRLLEVSDAKISMLNAFSLSDSVLQQAIRGISDIITKPGHINVDFADVRTIMKDMGMAIMGTGRATGADRARQATLAAITSPLLENVSIAGAKGVLLNITGTSKLGLYEINDAATLVHDMVSEDANIILGSVIDESLGDEIVVTVIATGFNELIAAQPQSANNLERQTKMLAAQPVIEQAQPKIEVQTITQEKSAEAKAFEEALAELEREELAMAAISAKPPEVSEPFEQTKTTDEDSSLDLDNYDTPTFLRKKLQMEQGQNGSH